MKTTTLEEIEVAQATAAQAQHQATAAQAAVNKLIEAYKSTRKRILQVFAVDIELNDGERYAGAILNEDGTTHHHIILLAGELESSEWDDAMAWAAQIGGHLPDCREQSLLFANLKSCFGAFAYWSREPFSERSAWCQYFHDGDQDCVSKSAELRARAVRSVFP